MENFYASLPELKELKSRQIPLDARRGYFEGLDCRKVICDSEHLMLAGYLQNGEAIITKKWIQTWKQMADQFGLWYRLVDYVHDEAQTEVLTESDGELLKMIQKKAMNKVNEELNLFCPMDVESKVGYNWAECH